MFDIFYFGSKPNVAPFELPASSLEEAANKSKTEFFWYIYGGNDYNGFNFYVKPAPWEQAHDATFSSTEDKRRRRIDADRIIDTGAAHDVIPEYVGRRIHEEAIRHAAG